MIKEISDVKKFWLVALLYWVVFWIFPVQSGWIDIFFGFLDNLFSIINITVPSVFIYFFLFIPLVILSCSLFVKRFNLKYKWPIFIFVYVLLPYISIISFVFYAYIKIVQNMRLSF